MRFSDEQWLPEDEASATIGVDFRVSRRTPSFLFLMLRRFIDCAFQVHKMEVKGRKVKLSIWVRISASLSCGHMARRTDAFMNL